MNIAEALPLAKRNPGTYLLKATRHHAWGYLLGFHQGRLAIFTTQGQFSHFHSKPDLEKHWIVAEWEIEQPTASQTKGEK